MASPVLIVRGVGRLFDERNQARCMHRKASGYCKVENKGANILQHNAVIHCIPMHSTAWRGCAKGNSKSINNSCEFMRKRKDIMD